MADRTVTTRLKLAVTDWTAGARTVKGDLKELNRRFTESAGFAAGFRKKLEEATKKLPKIDINVDSSAAEVKVADIRQRLEQLSGKKVGVDIDAADAYAELQALQSELQALDGADVAFEVRAGVAQALAELQAIDKEIDRVDGREARVRVDAEVGGALAKIALVNAAAAALPAAGSLVVGVGALGGAFTAAGVGAAAFGAVAIPTLGRINAALAQQEQAEEKARKAAGDLVPKWTDLSKAEKDLGRNMKAFSDDYVTWQQSLRPEVFPVINQGFSLMRLGLKEATPLAKSASSAFLTLGRDAETALTGPFWQRFLFDVNTQIPGALTGLGRSFGNVTVGIAGVIQAFLPWTPTVVGGLEKATAAFATWGKNLSSSNDFKEFIAWVKTNAPAAWGEIKQIAAALVHVGESVAPLGVGAFSGIALLAKIVSGMSPGQIQAIALAILAIKGAQTGLQVAGFWAEMISKVGGLGGAADKTKGKLGGLASSLATGGGIAAIVGTAAVGVDKVSDSLSGLNPNIAELSKQLVELQRAGKPAGEQLGAFGSNLGTLAGDMGRSGVWFAPTIGQFEGLGDTVRRLNDGGILSTFGTDFASTVDSVTGGLYTMDTGVQRLGNADKTLAEMVKSGNGAQAAALFNELGKQSGLAGQDVGKLRDLLPGYSAAVEAAGGASAAAAGGVERAKSSVDGLNTSLGTFAARTDAVQAIRNMESAFGAARTAMDRSSAGLDINKAKTDAQRDAVIQAREKFSAYISSVTTAADGAKTLSGRTTDATRTILEQLPHLGSLAGKNSEAKEQVLLLAKAYGISEADARKAMSSAEGLKKVLAELKSKEIRIGLTMDVSAAEKEFGSFIARYSNKSLAIALATKTRATGGIQTSRGVDLMAAGGLKGSSSTSPPPPPAIRSQATYVPGSATVYAEAGREAYIPYDTSYRQRAIQILGQVANDFGLEVYSKQAEQKTTTLVSGLQATNTSITTSLDGATRQLDSTLGSSGTLTQAVGSVGAVGTQMATAWTDGSKVVGDSVVGVNQAIGISSDMIVVSTEKVKDAALTVADVVAKAAQLIASAAATSGGSGKGSQGSVVPPAPGGTGKGSQGSTNVPAPGGTGRGSQGSVIPPAPGSSSSLNSSNSVAGDYGTSGYMTGGASLSTNYSRVSAPQVVSGGSIASLPGVSPSSSTGSTSSAEQSGGGVTVNVDMSGSIVRDPTDIPKLAARFGYEYQAQP